MPEPPDKPTAAAEPSVPRYRELPPSGLPASRSGWGVFGPNDDLGRLGLRSPAAVLAAAAEVRRGEVFNLSLPLDLPNPPWAPERHPYVHRIHSPSRNEQDDHLDSFYLQASSQWDGFRHIRAAALGFWGGVSGDDAGPSGARLGIQAWAEFGIVGRGVLVDVARQLDSEGRPLDPHTETPIMVDDLRRTLAAAGVTLRRGDILLLRTGYLEAYLAADAEARLRFTDSRDCPGLYAGEEMAEFLWDSGVSAVVADNPAVESFPGSREAGSLHRRLIPLLGFALGELFRLGELAADCAAHGSYTCLFVAAPLNLPGGVASPANALAIR